MTIQNLEFFVEIAKDLNLTKTADRLFTTQQNLSSHIKRLEEEFNTVFIIRKPAVSLTRDGELLLESARIIINAEKQLRAKLNTAHYPEKQLARVACYPWRLGIAVPDIMYHICQKYPEAQVIFVPPEKNEAIAKGPKTEHIEKAFADHDINFAIGTWGKDTNKLNAVPLFDSQSYFIIHKDCLRPYVDNVEQYERSNREGLEMSRIPGGVPIIRRMQDGLQVPQALAYDVPDIAAHSGCRYLDDSTYEYASNLCRKGQAALFAPTLQVIRSFRDCSDDILVFPLTKNGKRVIYTYYLYYLNNINLTAFQKGFISILKEVFRSYSTDAIPQIRKSSEL